VTSPNCVEALRAVLSPVKREDTFYRDSSRPAPTDDAATTSIASQTNVGMAQSKSHLLTAASTSSAADKLSGTAAGMTLASDKHGQQCVYCAQLFKSKCELERHVKATHVMPTTSQKCNICDEVFPSAAVLAQHKLTHCKVDVCLL